MVHSGACGPLPGPGVTVFPDGRVTRVETLGIGMPSAAASWASVVRQFSHLAHVPARTWLTSCSDGLVIALAGRYPAVVVCRPPHGVETWPPAG